MKIKLFMQYIYKELGFIFSLCFLLLICLLLFLLGFERITGIVINKTQLYENRSMAVFPDLRNEPLVEIPQALENYFNDNLPLRTQIIYKYRKLWKNALLSNTERMVECKDSHVNYYNLILQYQGIKHLSTADLYRIKNYIYGLWLFYTSNGANYYFGLIPDKTTLYPEFLPDWVGRDCSWYQQILPMLQQLEEFGVKIINFKKIMSDNKDKGLLYNIRYDVSHPNGLGLSVIYASLCSVLEADNYAFGSVADRRYTIRPVSKVITSDFDGKSEVIPWLYGDFADLGAEKHMFEGDKKFDNIWKNTDLVINSRKAAGALMLRADSVLKSSHQDFPGFSNGAVFPIAYNVHTLIDSHYDNTAYKFLQDTYRKCRIDSCIDIVLEKQLQLYGKMDENRELFVASELSQNEPKVLLTPQVLGLSPDDGSPESCSIYVAENFSPVSLPDILPNADGRICILAYMNSPVDGSIVVNYRQTDNKFKAFSKIEQNIEKGDNYIYLPLYGTADMPFELSVDFSVKNTEYIFYRLPYVPDILKVSTE